MKTILLAVGAGTVGIFGIPYALTIGELFGRVINCFQF